MKQLSSGVSSAVGNSAAKGSAADGAGNRAEAAQDEEFVRDFCARNGWSMGDHRIFQAAWILAADKPNHPLVRWVRRWGEKREGQR